VKSQYSYNFTAEHAKTSGNSARIKQS